MATEATGGLVIAGEQAKAKRIEARTAWSSFMDNLEESIGDNGAYFVKVGGKTAGKDTRALILSKPYKHPYRALRTHVIITADGPKGIEISGDGPSALGNLVERLEKGSLRIDPDKSMLAGNKLTIFAAPEDPKVQYPRRQTFDVIELKNPSVVYDAIKGSVQGTDALHKARSGETPLYETILNRTSDILSQHFPRET